MDKTFLKGLTLLETMARGGPTWGVTELADRLELGKSNIHRLLQALVHQGFAQKTENGRYRLTVRVWELGARIIGDLDVRSEALPAMRQLADSTRETVHLSILDGIDTLYLEKIDSPQPVRAYTRVGGRAPAANVATGKVLLAWADDAVVAGAAQQLRPHTPKSIQTPAALHQALQDVRNNGYAINEGEWRAEVVGVAAPLHDANGRVVAALGLSGPAQRLTHDIIQGTLPELLALARSTSARLGHTPD